MGLGIAKRRSKKIRGEKFTVARTYANCFVMSFDAEGRCREFTEYYLRHPDGKAA